MHPPAECALRSEGCAFCRRQPHLSGFTRIVAFEEFRSDDSGDVAGALRSSRHRLEFERRTLRRRLFPAAGRDKNNGGEVLRAHHAVHAKIEVIDVIYHFPTTAAQPQSKWSPLSSPSGPKSTSRSSVLAVARST